MLSRVERIVLGAAEIDRMKREIDTMITLLAGYIKAHFEQIRFEFAEDSAGTKVTLWEWPNGTQRYKWHLIAKTGEVSLTRDQPSGVEVLVYSSKGRPAELRQVETVHRALDQFVDGMLAKFPGLQYAVMEPLNAAAGQASSSA